MDQEKGIDFLRRHIGVSYEKAKEALTNANNDLIEAIMQLKGKQAILVEQWEVYGPDLRERLKELLHQAQVIRITIKRNGRTLWVIPAWLGAVSFILFPVISLLGTIMLLYNNVTLTVEKMAENES